MSVVALKKYFSTHTPGNRTGITLLDDVVHPLRDPALSEPMSELFWQQCSYSHKRLARNLVIHGAASEHRALLMANLAHRCQLPVCHVGERFYQQLERADLARLFADSEHRTQLLFFDQADPLLSGDLQSADNESNWFTAALLKLSAQRQGITVFAVNDAAVLDGITTRFDAVIDAP